MANYHFELVRVNEEALLRRMLADNPMAGQISVAFEREPNYFWASETEGDIYEVIGAKKDNELIAIASRSIHHAFVNGISQRIGYLSQLRVSEKHRELRLLVDGHRFIRERNTMDPVTFHLTSIIADNEPAIKVLTSGRFGLPKYSLLGTLHTMAIPLRKTKKMVMNNKITIIRGNREMAHEIIAFLQDVGKTKQLYPFYTLNDIESPIRSRDLNWEHFYIALQNGQIIGVSAVWDQGSFKQTVVKSYDWKMRWVKRIYDWNARLRSYSPLPNPNFAFHYFYLSHIAISENDPLIFSAIVDQVYNDYLHKGYAHFMIGLFEHDPLLASLQVYKPMKYASQIYKVDFEAEETSFVFDNRLPYLEIARL